jgi:hypothetical protein
LRFAVTVKVSLSQPRSGTWENNREQRLGSELCLFKPLTLNRIRFDEAADDLTIKCAVNGSADELERRVRLHLLAYFGGRRLSSIITADVNASF